MEGKTTGKQKFVFPHSPIPPPGGVFFERARAYNRCTLKNYSSTVSEELFSLGNFFSPVKL
jgi:hypothetical protein